MEGSIQFFPHFSRKLFLTTERKLLFELLFCHELNNKWIRCHPCTSILLFNFVAELPPSIATSTAYLSSQQGKVPLRLASCSSSCGVPPQASVKKQQPQASKKQRISSTSSVCTTSSKKSCKSTASQIQEVAGDGEYPEGGAGREAAEE